jgi:hypothetical protein
MENILCDCIVKIVFKLHSQKLFHHSYPFSLLLGEREERRGEKRERGGKRKRKKRKRRKEFLPLPVLFKTILNLAFIT